MSVKSSNSRTESGFALILALLALMLLTFLGLTLAATTSTELRVALNYRWSTQAVYNAEAGIEAGKRILQGLNWTAILPPARGAWSPPTALPFTAVLPTAPTGGTGGTRNNEMGPCDKLGNGVGYGLVLFDGTNAFQNVTTVPTFVTPPALNGAFTLWIRRPIIPAGVAGQYKDDGSTDNTLVLTAEGIAPYTGAAAGGTLASTNAARRLIEVTVQKSSQPAPCDTRGGQIGGGPEGNNVFGGPCNGLDPANALANVTFAPGSKTRITPP